MGIEDELGRLIKQSPDKPKDIQECRPLREILQLMDSTQLMVLNGALKKAREVASQSSRYANSLFDIVKELVAVGGENYQPGEDLRYTYVTADQSVGSERIVDPRPSNVARYSLIEITDKETKEGEATEGETTEGEPEEEEPEEEKPKERVAKWVRGMSGLTPYELQQRAMQAANGVEKAGPSATFEEMIKAGKELNSENKPNNLNNGEL